MTRNSDPTASGGTTVRDWQEVRADLVRNEEEVAARSERALSRLRRRLGHTQRDVANVMGVSQARVASIESGDLTATQVGTLSRYIAALGGRLSIVVDFDGRATILEP